MDVWVKNYTMAHVKLGELINIRCTNDVLVIIG